MSNWAFRGVDNLVFAEVLVDDAYQYVTGEVMELSAVAKIAKKTENSSSPEFYNNIPLFVVQGLGATTLELSITPPDLKKFSLITGQDFDASKGTMIEGERENRYFAVGYKYQGTDNHTRYAWYYKCSFNIPDETYDTINSGTDTTNIVITCTAINTTHKFAYKGKSARGIIADDRLANYGFDKFFTSVVTPDNQPTGNNGVYAPEFLPTTSTFTGSLQITMATATQNGNIYYTLDGTDPSSASEAYTEPFTISETTTIKAYTSTGMAGSPIVTKTYVKVTV